MKLIFLIAYLLAVPPQAPLPAQAPIPPQAPPVRVESLPVAKDCDKGCQCKKDGKCSCSNGKCVCKACKCQPAPVTKEPDYEPLEEPEPVPESGTAVYGRLSEQAHRDNAPLVVGIGCEPIVPLGYLGCRCDEIGWAPGVWVSVPHNGELRAGQSPLPPTANVQQVRDELFKLRWKLSPPTSYVQPVQYQPQYQPQYQSYSQPRYTSSSRSC